MAATPTTRKQRNGTNGFVDLRRAIISVEDIHDSLPSPTRPTNISSEDWTDYRQLIEGKIKSVFSPSKVKRLRFV